MKLQHTVQYVLFMALTAACTSSVGADDHADAPTNPGLGSQASTGEGFRFTWFSQAGWDHASAAASWRLNRLDAMVFEPDQVTIAVPWTEDICADLNPGPHIWDCFITNNPLSSGSAVVLNVLYEAPDDTGAMHNAWMCNPQGCMEYPQFYSAENDGLHVVSAQIKPLFGKTVCIGSPACEAPLVIRLP